MKSNTPKLKLFDTYRRSIVEFKPIHKGEVSLYACGPTVYDYAHIGNLRTYIFVDILHRTLELFGYSVNHVMNITDVGHLVSDGDTGEDKMETDARKQNKSAWEIAIFFEEAFFDDIENLNIKKPNTVSRATDHIQEQIEYIEGIEAFGYTYATSDGVYFDSTRVSNYGYLARLDIKGLQAGKRVDTAEKRTVTDFALWKFSGKSQRQMEWSSPWGVGFPGWHIECSAMAEKYLGPLFDIHVGGEDHIPVHHSNEMAQCQARHNTRMANYWMHGYFLRLDKEKISKSGRSILLKTLADQGYHPLAYRYVVLTSHYRNTLDFTWTSLDAAQKTLMRLFRLMAGWPEAGSVNTDYQYSFNRRLGGDLNTPQALAVLWELVQDNAITGADKKATILYFDQVLGLNLGKLPEVEPIPEEIELLAKNRQQARDRKDWNESDHLRNRIGKLGYTIEDLPGGYRLSLASAR